MKLSELIPHTSEWLGIPKTVVTSVARELRPAGLLSSGGRGPGGADMTVDDKINLLLGVCGVEVAKKAAEYVKQWRRSIRYRRPNHYMKFAFLDATNIKDLIVDLITKDLNGGPLDAWLKEADDALSDTIGHLGSRNHEITVDFFINEFSLDLYVSRNVLNSNLSAETRLEKISTDTICVRFVPPPPSHEVSLAPRLKPLYMAPSKLIRRLNEVNLIGWGQCLRNSS